MRRMLAVLCTGMLVASAAFGGWSDDASSNQPVCVRAGEQTDSKVVWNLDGGCYVGWQDNSSGNYDIYLQRFDAGGNPMWAENGLLISDHTQNSWITDWGMSSETDGNCYIAINDYRNGGYWDVFAYCIAPDGTFVWGPDGVAVSEDSNNSAMAPQIECLSNGSDVYLSWTDVPNNAGPKVKLAKLNSEGVVQWTKSIEGGDGFEHPWIVDLYDHVIFQYTSLDGFGYTAVRHLLAMKYDADGTEQWAAPAVISDAGYVDGWTQYKSIPDGSNGIYSFWTDSRSGGRHNVWMQRIGSDGTVLWQDDGVQVSAANDRLKMNPVALMTASNPDTVAVLFRYTDLDQNLTGVQAQSFDGDGNLLWGANGEEFVPLSSMAIAFLGAERMSFGQYCYYYAKATNGSATEAEVYAGNFGYNAGWTGQTLLSGVTSGKGKLSGTVTEGGDLVVAWNDDRNDNEDLYAQNVNQDGTLGASGPPVPAISITAPVGGAQIDEQPFNVTVSVANFNVAETGGDGKIKVNVTGLEGWFETATTFEVEGCAPGEVTIRVELVNYDESSLDPAIADEVVVTIAEPPVPAIAFTAPEDGASVATNPVEIVLDVTDFTVAETDGDGHVKFTCTNGDVSVEEIHHTATFSFDGLTVGENTLTAELVDNSDQPLAPAVSATIRVTLEDSGVADGSAVPVESALNDAYPNPFNPTTTLNYQLAASSQVRLTVYDVLGREVAEVVNEVRSAGVHSVSWDAEGLASGLYFVRMHAGEFNAMQKIIKMK